MEQVYYCDHSLQGFNAINFIRSVQAYKTYERLGIERLMVYINDVVEFEGDEPGKVDA